MAQQDAGKPNDAYVKVVPPARFELATPAFITTTTFVATLEGVCVLDFPFIIPTKVGLDAHRQVSTPSPCGAWLGIAILQVSPTLMSFHPKVSLRGRKNKSTNAMLYQLS